MSLLWRVRVVAGTSIRGRSWRFSSGSLSRVAICGATKPRGERTLKTYRAPEIGDRNININNNNNNNNYKQKEAQMIPIAIPSTAATPKSLSHSLTTHNLHPNTYIQLQKSVILGTCSIVRNFLNYK